MRNDKHEVVICRVHSFAISIYKLHHTSIIVQAICLSMFLKSGHKRDFTKLPKIGKLTVGFGIVFSLLDTF